MIIDDSIKEKPYKSMKISKLLLIGICFLNANAYAAGDTDAAKIKQSVYSTIQPVMQKYKIPGMAIAITVHGKRYFYNYGVASRATKQPITSDTLFEIGSISKTFTATLAAYAQINGDLSLSDSVSKYLPSLHGSHLDSVSLLHLGTHTAGGFPLQVPDEISTTDQLMKYLKNWRPTYPAGTQRTYSNISIGMLGMIVARSMHQPFDSAIEKTLFSAIGMTHSYITVPATQMNNYAQGYSRKDAPVRMQTAILASEAYGIKSNTVDMLRFVEANMQVTRLAPKWQKAIINTHTGYYRCGEMTQDLVWEQYHYPVTLKQLLTGNSETMTFETNPVTKLGPALPPQANVLINKTGSTNGFAAYVAFIPARKIGVVILANKNYPIPARVTATYKILTQLDCYAKEK